VWFSLSDLNNNLPKFTTPHTHSARNLGFILDQHFSLSDQIYPLSTLCFSYIRELCCLCLTSCDFKTATSLPSLPAYLHYALRSTIGYHGNSWASYYFFDQELISYRNSSSSCCCCWVDLFKKPTKHKQLLKFYVPLVCPKNHLGLGVITGLDPVGVLLPSTFYCLVPPGSNWVRYFCRV